jgi:hypothetical protein
LVQRQAADKDERELNQFLESRDLDRLHPETYQLRKLPWLITGTLTWRSAGRKFDSDKSKQFRDYDFNLLLFKTADLTNNRLKDFATISADENHMTGEFHKHFLIGNSGLKNINAYELSKLMTNLWEDELLAFDRRWLCMSHPD